MADLYLCVDTGGSQTKIIYQAATASKPSHLLMPPSVEEIQYSTLQRFFGQQGWIGSPAPEQRAWLEVDKRFFVVGAFASFFAPEDRIFEPKYENALYKVLAAIGVIVQNLKLPTTEPLTVQLGLLLPWNEYSDRHRFQGFLEKMLEDYKFRGDNIKVNLERFVCRPEGGGLAATRIRHKGVDWLREQNLGVLMVGHRNTTALFFEGGTLKHGDSPLLGFSLLLDRVVSQKSGLDRDKLASAIFKGIYAAQKEIYSYRFKTRHPDWKSLEAIKALATAKDASLRASEVSDIVNAIEVATADYWDKLKRWLNKALPDELDEIIVSGGAALYLEPELEEYFNCQPDYEFGTDKRNGRYSPRQPSLHKTDIIWGAGILEVVEKTFELKWKKEKEQALSHRLIDVFGLFDYIIGLQSEAKKQVEEETEAKKKAEELALAETEAKKKALAKEKAAASRAKAKASKLDSQKTTHS